MWVAVCACSSLVWPLLAGLGLGLGYGAWAVIVPAFLGAGSLSLYTLAVKDAILQEFEDEVDREIGKHIG